MDDPYKLPLHTIPHKTMAVHGTPCSASGVLLHAGVLPFPQRHYEFAAPEAATAAWRQLGSSGGGSAAAAVALVRRWWQWRQHGNGGHGSAAVAAAARQRRRQRGNGGGSAAVAAAAGRRWRAARQQGGGNSGVAAIARRGGERLICSIFVLGLHPDPPC
jgi:hypothetical protein